MRKQGAGKFPALILYNEMMTVPGKNLFSQIGNQTVKNTCCKECTDTLGNKIRQNAEVMVEHLLSEQGCTDRRMRWPQRTKVYESCMAVRKLK